MKRSTSLYLDEDDLLKVAKIADELGYRSLSALVSDIFKEVIAMYEILTADKRMRKSKQAKRKIILTSIIRKILSRGS